MENPPGSARRRQASVDWRRPRSSTSSVKVPTFAGSRQAPAVVARRMRSSSLRRALLSVERHKIGAARRQYLRFG